MKRLAVLGHPVAHSRSPAMQNAALEELGVAGEWAYEAIDVAPDKLERRVRAMPGEGFVGANVTIPHKEAAFELADTPDDGAVAIGAVNTLCFARREIQGYNTDATGLLEALPSSPSGARALVLGAGGAARAAIWALGYAGARVDAWNRSHARARLVYRQLSGYVELGGSPVEFVRQGDYDLIVNSTAVGLHGEDPFEQLPLTRGEFGDQVVVDLVYGDAPSPLLAVAAAAGAATVDGIEVLVRQGALSLKIWTGHEPPLDVMEKAAREGLSR